jgi:hypothetical protein
LGIAVGSTAEAAEHRPVLWVRELIRGNVDELLAKIEEVVAAPRTG